MKKKLSAVTALLWASAAAAPAQQTDIVIKLMGGDKPAMAVPDLRGAGAAGGWMSAFNSTLFSDLQDAGLFRMVPKSVYPLEVPQRPQDFKAPLPPPARPRRGQEAKPVRQGPWLTDWSEPPASANYLAMGYAAEQGGSLVLFGWLFNVTQNDVANAQVFGKLYFGPMEESGARKVAHEFAADILEKFGQRSLAGSKIYFTSERTGHKEIWSMDWDGAGQKQLTFLSSITSYLAISPDNTKLAISTFAKDEPQIFLLSLETGRRLTFYNQRASMNATPEFTPDGKSILFSSTAGGGAPQIYACDLDGRNMRPISTSRSIEVSPRVNPKTGNELVFVSGRSGPAQIYKMNMDGADVARLTTGEGEAHNPAWHPDGKHIAFAWTKGYDPGNFNIFVMDVATREIVQLTHGAGRNENPTWAPDGRHLVFSSNRGGSMQIWTMLADGTQLRQLTTQGRNTTPVWSR